MGELRPEIGRFSVLSVSLKGNNQEQRKENKIANNPDEDISAVKPAHFCFCFKLCRYRVTKLSAKLDMWLIYSNIQRYK